MASTQITFTPNQIAYLREWFLTQSKQYVGTVMDDDFEADEDNFERLCLSTFNVNGFREGVMETNPRDVKVKKQRKKKDPNEPKRPKSAYMCWLWSHDGGVQKVKDENDGIAHKEAVAKASIIWNDMTDDDKKDWTEMSSKEKTQYESNMKDYIATKDGTNDTKDGTNDTKDGTNDTKDGTNDTKDGSDDESQQEQFEGFTKMEGKFISGYSSAGKTKFDSLQSAVDAFQEDSGGIVYDGNKYTIRKIGQIKNSNKNETLWIKK